MLKNFVKKFLPKNAINLFWHLPKAVLAALIYGFPAKKLFVIAVAGTKGKSTTCHLIARILEQAGEKVAMLSTTTTKIAEQKKLNTLKMTTPSSGFLQKFLSKAVYANCKYAVLEVSSHALKQHRTFGIPFKTAVITNLMPDHLEYHKTAEDYQRSHLRLITPSLKTLVINRDDADLSEFIKISSRSPASLREVSQREKGRQEYKNIKITLFQRTDSMAEQLRQIQIPLLGEFNFQNALAAATTAQTLGIDFEIIKKALQNPGVVPGRLEKIKAGQNFTIIVDYAHSPDSLRSLFQAISSSVLIRSNPHKSASPKVITVFGACGERDASKRPLMGQILDKNSDIIIVTNDDPYGEDPEKIARELMSGIARPGRGSSPSTSEGDEPLPTTLFKILDRREAIKKAISLAQKDDLVLILGKGAEQWQVFENGRKIPWDDRKIVKEFIQKTH